MHDAVLCFQVTSIIFFLPWIHFDPLKNRVEWANQKYEANILLALASQLITLIQFRLFLWSQNEHSTLNKPLISSFFSDITVSQTGELPDLIQTHLAISLLCALHVLVFISLCINKIWTEIFANATNFGYRILCTEQIIHSDNA